MSRPFAEGEQVLFIDTKKRRYLITLAATKEFHSHSGTVAHDAIIGATEGATFRSSHGMYYTVIRPTLSEFILKMPRGAQVIYPKDLGPILLLADVFPGARVLESGIGSGALSMTLLRYGADIVGYEVRDDFAARAVKNVTAFLGEDVLTRYRVEVRDVYEGIEETDLDRVILDLPEPWQVVKHAPDGTLREGGHTRMPLAAVPKEVLDLAVRAAAAIGTGLYGVDLKESPDGPLVIEVNDNPSLETGIEVTGPRDPVWAAVVDWFAARW